VSRNVDDAAGETENGSVWLKRGDRLQWVEDFGGGSEVKDIVNEWRAGRHRLVPKLVVAIRPISLLDLGVVGVAVVAAFFWSVWVMFCRLSKNHFDPQWRGVFEGGAACLLCLAVEGMTNDRFVPWYPQVNLW
jgi:hypothetical protein